MFVGVPERIIYTSLGMGRYGGVFLPQGGEFQRPWKRCSIIPKCVLEVEIAMGQCPVPIFVSSPCFALRYEVPHFYLYLVVVVAMMISDGYNMFIDSGGVYPIIGTIVAVDSGPAAGGGGSYDRAGTCLATVRSGVLRF